VHRAVRELLADGSGPISVRAVAELSGVHEVTVYRRWPSVEALMLDVAVSRLNEDHPFPDTGDLRADLLAWARAVAVQVRTREGFALYSALAAATSPVGGDDPAAAADAARYLRRRTDQIQRSLERSAGARGLPAPSVRRVFDVILAPIYLRAVFGYETPGADLDELVDRALAER
jgi:AcrR family transcriptional regulator